MENFVVSARKYRPATFDTVVGQFSITSTLKNAIRNKHMAQAFLFCGPRGVGKTTCARILAKTINCLHKTENIEACDQCDSCISFNTSHSLNVFELDAASNNSVDDIRKLIDQVRFAPQLGSHKVYIIDEVHMLSPQAFNAFLKTLEEPPAHAIFILATTEKHKIIPTILSRCQIFDFNRIQIDDMVTHLQEISTKEKIDAEIDGLHVIAQKADGALRDALSMFDQIVTFTGSSITYKAVIENLNILDYDYYFKATESILKNNIPSSLLLFNEILNFGFDGHNYLVGLAGHLRNLLVCKDPSTIQLLEVGANIKEKYKLQSQICSQPFILTALNLLNQSDIQYKSSKNQRFLVELTLMQLCSINGNANADAEKKNDIILIMAPGAFKSATIVAPVEVKPSVFPKSSETPKEIKPKPVQVQKPMGLSALGQSKTISISQVTSKTIPEINLNTETVNGNQNKNDAKENRKDFNQNELIYCWNRYAQIILNQGKRSLYATVNSHKPVLNDNYSVLITLENEVQREDMKTEQTELLAFLKAELFNSDIVLDIVVNEVSEGKKLFTTQEKFNHMVEKNPNLLLLKQKLDLELGF